jgi:hypothetical protein
MTTWAAVGEMSWEKTDKNAIARLTIERTESRRMKSS